MPCAIAWDVPWDIARAPTSAAAIAARTFTRMPLLPTPSILLSLNAEAADWLPSLQLSHSIDRLYGPGPQTYREREGEPE
jgi:hypothetical protein